MYRDEKKLPKLEGLNDLKSMFYKDCMGSHGPNCRGHRRKGPSIRRSVVKRLHPSD
ncbi:hypothetical protein FRC09_011600 [Ceratobasidium sp. 395]|nr:hypothetical protein FRC09_011600 [Ceratobasidium sp. 395]